MKILPILTENVIAVEGPPQVKWTYADWEKFLPDDGNRYEIIDGYAYYTGVPSTLHQRIVGHLLEFVAFPAEDLKLGYGILGPVAVRMLGCDPVQPDVLFVRKERAAIIHDGLIWSAPDLIVEVLFPGGIGYDEGVKLEAYARADVPEYAVIDPRARKLRLYTLRQPGAYDSPHEFSGDDTISFACLPSIRFRLGALFEGAPDTTL